MTRTGLFPVFFSMLSFMMQTSVLPAIAMLLIWLLWSWAGALMIQGFAVGEADIAYPGEDISPGLSLVLMMALRSWSTVQSGCSERSKPPAPVTCGAAIEVPLI